MTAKEEHLFDLAFAGNEHVVQRIFFDSKGNTQSDEEFDIIFAEFSRTSPLSQQEQLQRIYALRSAKSSQKAAKLARERVSSAAQFADLTSAADIIRARSLGVILD